MKIHRSYLYIDLDNVMMDFYKHFRKYNYTNIIINNIHPLDVDLKNYISSTKVKNLVDETCKELPMNFWLNVPISNVGKFYWNRLKQYKDRIYFFTNCRSDNEKEFKLLWINTYLKEYDPRKLITNSINTYHKSLLYHNIIITSNKTLSDKWESLGSVGLFDLGKRSVASYYLERKIIPHLEMYPGFNYFAEIPVSRKPKLSKSKDITSITLDELNILC